MDEFNSYGNVWGGNLDSFLADSPGWDEQFDCIMDSLAPGPTLVCYRHYRKSRCVYGMHSQLGTHLADKYKHCANPELASTLQGLLGGSCKDIVMQGPPSLGNQQPPEVVPPQPAHTTLAPAKQPSPSHDSPPHPLPSSQAAATNSTPQAPPLDQSHFASAAASTPGMVGTPDLPPLPSPMLQDPEQVLQELAQQGAHPSFQSAGQHNSSTAMTGLCSQPPVTYRQQGQMSMESQGQLGAGAGAGPAARGPGGPARSGPWGWGLTQEPGPATGGLALDTAMALLPAPLPGPSPNAAGGLGSPPPSRPLLCPASDQFQDPHLHQFLSSMHRMQQQQPADGVVRVARGDPLMAPGPQASDPSPTPSHPPSLLAALLAARAGGTLHQAPASLSSLPTSLQHAEILRQLQLLQAAGVQLPGTNLPAMATAIMAINASRQPSTPPAVLSSDQVPRLSPFPQTLPRQQSAAPPMPRSIQQQQQQQQAGAPGHATGVGLPMSPLGTSGAVGLASSYSLPYPGMVHSQQPPQQQEHQHQHHHPQTMHLHQHHQHQLQLALQLAAVKSTQPTAQPTAQPPAASSQFLQLPASSSLQAVAPHRLASATSVSADQVPPGPSTQPMGDSQRRGPPACTTQADLSPAAASLVVASAPASRHLLKHTAALTKQDRTSGSPPQQQQEAAAFSHFSPSSTQPFFNPSAPPMNLPVVVGPAAATGPAARPPSRSCSLATLTPRTGPGMLEALQVHQPQMAEPHSSGGRSHSDGPRLPGAGLGAPHQSANSTAASTLISKALATAQAATDLVANRAVAGTSASQAKDAEAAKSCKQMTIQEKNRSAQQRFRARQRDRMTGLEEKCEELATSVRSLAAALQHQVAENGLLEKVLALRDEHIVHLAEAARAFGELSLDSLASPCAVKGGGTGTAAEGQEVELGDEPGCAAAATLRTSTALLRLGIRAPAVDDVARQPEQHPAGCATESCITGPSGTEGDSNDEWEHATQDGDVDEERPHRRPNVVAGSSAGGTLPSVRRLRLRRVQVPGANISTSDLMMQPARTQVRRKRAALGGASESHPITRAQASRASLDVAAGLAPRCSLDAEPATHSYNALPNGTHVHVHSPVQSSEGEMVPRHTHNAHDELLQPSQNYEMPVGSPCFGSAVPRLTAESIRSMTADQLISTWQDGIRLLRRQLEALDQAEAEGGAEGQGLQAEVAARPVTERIAFLLDLCHKVGGWREEVVAAHVRYTSKMQVVLKASAGCAACAGATPSFEHVANMEFLVFVWKGSLERVQQQQQQQQQQSVVCMRDLRHHPAAAYFAALFLSHFASSWPELRWRRTPSSQTPWHWPLSSATTSLPASPRHVNGH
ncbi:hypothetical protein QJQ45_023136 [Haematococcus lacustris]|nr:hypothetical protein QJQ45_023136 [Haematococcus lacustris]